MVNFTNKIVFFLFLPTLIFWNCQEKEQAIEKHPPYSPEKELGPLFEEIQLSGLFTDSKTFVDCFIVDEPEAVLQAYQQGKSSGDFSLNAFVKEKFDLPQASVSKTVNSTSFKEHLTSLWPMLTRKYQEDGRISSLLPLPYQYVVPGGRFREIYYWDSYFTMEGLAVSGNEALVLNMTDNFAYLIDQYGHIPNGNRTYFLSRSQPPFFAQMVRLVERLKGKQFAQRYLPQLKKEYEFWMDGSNTLNPRRPTYRRVVRLRNGSIMNRYWDDEASPRPESYKEDLELAEKLPERKRTKFYQDIKAACESGWDFSSRWFADSTLSSVQTTDILPVDLNCLMYSLEDLIAHLSENVDSLQSEVFAQKADQRANMIQKLCYSESDNFYYDFNWKSRKISKKLTLAGMFPFFMQIADSTQTEAFQMLQDSLLLQGGLVTTTVDSHEQWDYPNGWAPLQFVAVKGLKNYGADSLAHEVATRWLSYNKSVYFRNGKMMEKYDVSDTTLAAGGGEYPAQDGFGWTNGVALYFMDMFNEN